METFKALDAILEADTRNDLWHVGDPAAPDGHRPIRLAERYESIVDLNLDAAVPENIRSAFNIARNLWVYGWFHYPFYTVASFQAYVALEAALQERWTTDPNASPKPPRGLRRLLSAAVERGWISDVGLRAKQDADRRRREMRDSLPPPFSEIFAVEPDESDTQAYVRTVADTLPDIRNSLAHGHSIHMPHHSQRVLVLVSGLLNQLFPG
ncbi:MAG TPA: hypothetical protein VEQ60_18095 [Longimicrobium sp.]|nr:hypothetical protein [Longimicrobium sp.]